MNNCILYPVAIGGRGKYKSNDSQMNNISKLHNLNAFCVKHGNK